jgi:hypothetical protein
MAASSSKGSRGGSKGSADLRSNRCFLPSWHKQPKCKCVHPSIIDTWEYDGTDREGMRYFKCADLDPEFMVW